MGSPVQLDIADITHDNGKPIVPFLSWCQLFMFHQLRLMRFLAHNGIFAIHESQEEHEAYALTPASKLLVKSSDHCLSPMAVLFTDLLQQNKFHHLGEWVLGEDPTLYETALGASVWEFFDQKTTAKIICEAFPKLKCVVFDLPKVVANLSGSNSLSYVGGDMFVSIPPADAVLLKVHTYMMR